MSLRLLTNRTPIGGMTPEKGDEMTRNGDTWIVEEVTELENGDSIVKLSPGEPSEPPSIEEDASG